MLGLIVVVVDGCFRLFVGFWFEGVAAVARFVVWYVLVVGLLFVGC